ncbi:unnamed protein product [Camellia sinensis]
MEKSVVAFDKGTTFSSWNYCDERLATGSIDGTLVIFDSVDPPSSSFTCTSTSRVHEVSIVKVVWVPPEYGGGVACICADGTLSLWEEVAEVYKTPQWKLCKGFETSSNQVLDMQFGASFTSLKLVVVAAYSNGHVKVYELLDPLELKNWQLQAEFQNVIDSVSKFGKAACLSASISWTAQRGESQQLSFVLGFNSNVMQLNSAKRFTATTLNGVAKITGEEWKNMIEKQKSYEKIAKQNKEKYLKEIEAYKQRKEEEFANLKKEEDEMKIHKQEPCNCSRRKRKPIT